MSLVLRITRVKDTGQESRKGPKGAQGTHKMVFVLLNVYRPRPKRGTAERIKVLAAVIGCRILH